MKQLTAKDKYLFARELETVLEAGMTVPDGLDLIEENLDAQLQEAASFLKKHMFENYSFAAAVRDCDGFDPYFARMVEIGELNGCLDRVMKELAVYYDREGSLETRIREAVSYPLVLVAMMAVIVGILLFKVLPVFTDVMYRIGVTSSSSSMRIMMASKIFAWVCFIFLLSVLAAALAVVLYLRLTDNTSAAADLLNKFPITGKLMNSVMLSRITFAFSLFVNSGYPLEEAVLYIPELLPRLPLREKVEKLIARLHDGASFTEGIQAEQIYTGSSLSILIIGLKTGRQEETFTRLAELYEQETDEKISAFLGTIEPTMVAVLSFMVGIILLAIMLPLISIMSTLG